MSTPITQLSSINCAMADLFHGHDYRGMYDYYQEVIMPAIQQLHHERFTARNSAGIGLRSISEMFNGAMDNLNGHTMRFCLPEGYIIEWPEHTYPEYPMDDPTLIWLSSHGWCPIHAAHDEYGAQKEWVKGEKYAVLEKKA